MPATAQQRPPAGAAAAPAEGAPARGGGRGRGAPRPPAGPTPHLPNDPYLGANAGKPDLGGNSQSITSTMKGIWQVPYNVDKQKQGCTVGDQKCYDSLGREHTTPLDVPFTAIGKKMYDTATATQSKDD